MNAVNPLLHILVPYTSQFIHSSFVCECEMCYSLYKENFNSPRLKIKRFIKILLTFHKFFMKKQKGFTLIELLVVIAIIAILSTVVMAGLNSARLKGRDAKRLSDIKQVQAALELFYDSGSGYPAITPASLLNTALAGVTGFTAYMNPLPTNPTPSYTGQTTYTYAGTATSYTITFGLEGQSGSLSGQTVHYATPSGII